MGALGKGWQEAAASMAARVASVVVEAAVALMAAAAVGQVEETAALPHKWRLTIGEFGTGALRGERNLFRGGFDAKTKSLRDVRMCESGVAKKSIACVSRD